MRLCLEIISTGILSPRVEIFKLLAPLRKPQTALKKKRKKEREKRKRKNRIENGRVH